MQREAEQGPPAALAELVRSMEESGRLAAGLAESMPAISAQLTALSVELYNGATELKQALDGRSPEPGAQPERSELQLGESEAWGIFDREDLEGEQPVPLATFESPEEAQGFLLLAAGGACISPVIRLCKVSGTVSLDVAPNLAVLP